MADFNLQRFHALVDVNNAISADVEAAVAAATGLRLVGYSCRESAGTAAAAAFNIQHSATVDLTKNIVTVELAANGSETKWLWPGIGAANGLTIDVVAGTVDVILFYTVIAN